jgi:ferredoxin
VSISPKVFFFSEKEDNPYDPQYWQITPVWLSLCTRCGKCVKACPQKAITVSY